MEQFFKKAFKSVPGLSLSILLATSVYAQEHYTPFAFSKNNAEMQKLCINVDSTGWLYFLPETKINPKDFLTQNHAALGFGSDDVMQAGSEYKDEYGSYHWFHHYYKKLPVEGSAFMMMEKENKLHLIHAKFVEKLNIDVTTKIDENVALANALVALGITDKQYKFNSPSREVIKYKDINDLNPNNYFHSYRFDIQNLKDKISYSVYIDAKTGEVFQKKSTKRGCNHQKETTENEEISIPASTNLFFSITPTTFANPQCASGAEGHAWTAYNGYQPIYTNDRSIFGWYNLDDYRNGIKVYETNVLPQINSCSNVWYDNAYQPATSAIYAAQRSYAYYKEKYGRQYPREGNDFKPTTFLYNPLDINVYHIDDPDNGTYYDDVGHGIQIIKPNNSTIQNTVDIVGHEITHAVMMRICDPAAVFPAYEDRPAYQGEAGALNESFGDIFGTCIENFSGTETFDWTMGENTGRIIRSLSDPKAAPYLDPDTYQGTYWASTTGNTSASDFGGVHTNSGVQNKWFYLLAQGGSQNGLTVTGIGITNAAKIAYRNMAVYAQNQWDYNSARTGSIQAANDLFGECSPQSNQVRNAWKAVGVGNNTDNCPKITISGSNQVITVASFPFAPATRTFTVTTTPSTVSYLSHNAPGWTVVKNGNTYTVNTNGVASSLTVTAVMNTQGGNTQASASRSIGYVCPTCRPNTGTGVVDLDNTTGTTNTMKLNLSPNPSKGVLNVSVESVTDESNTNKSVRIFDLQGKKMYETTFAGEKIELSVEHLINGMYILQINSASQSTVGKFIVNK